MAQGLVLSEKAQWVSGIGNVVFPWMWSRREHEGLRQIYVCLWTWRLLNLRFERNREARTWRLVSERDPSPFFVFGGVSSNQEGGAKAAAEKRGSPQCISSSCVSLQSQANDTDNPHHGTRACSGGDEEE